MEVRDAGIAVVLARTALGLAVCGLAVSGVVVATEGSTFPGVGGPTVALTPAAAVQCAGPGPYRAPARGSVGLPPGLELCASGPVTVSVPGTVLDGWDIRGGILVDAQNVIVRRSRITGNGEVPFGIRTTGSGSVRIEDSTLTGNFPEAAIGGDRWSAERVEIVAVTHDGARLGDGARLRNSSVHRFDPAPGAEPRGVVVRGSDGRVLVENNRIVVGPGGGIAVLLSPDPAGDRPGGATVIRSNELGGGRHTVLADPSAPPLGDVWVVGNRFLRGTAESPMQVRRQAVLEDNRYLDGGPLPGN